MWSSREENGREACLIDNTIKMYDILQIEDLESLAASSKGKAVRYIEIAI